MKQVTLLGGTHDCTTAFVNHWQNVLYMSKKLTLAEYNLLRMRDAKYFKSPEEVYIRVASDTFEFSHVSNYHPTMGYL